MSNEYTIEAVDDDFLEIVEYKDCINFNEKLYPIVVEWSNTKQDYRLYDPEYLTTRPTSFDMNFSWVSEHNIHELELFYPLRDFILEVVEQRLDKELKFHSMWLIIGTKGYWGKTHYHRGYIVGMYYISNGHDDEEEITGTINHYKSDGKIVTEPKDGQLYLASSNLSHSINEYTGDKHRVCVGFNLEPKKEVKNAK
jgi:hypothetical protein